MKSVGCRVAVEIVKIFFETKDWEGINSHIVLLSKRRQQLKQVLVEITQEAMTYLDQTPSKEVKLRLMETLRAVTDGKIHVELERARLTRMLAKIREDEGKVAEAAELMQEVQVETYGAMDKEEKVDYILEQVRLCLDKGDLVRGTIVSKKITDKTFKNDELQDLKVRYYDLVVRIHNEKDEYLEMAQAFFHQFETPTVKESPERWMQALKSVAVYLVLSKFDNHHHDFLVRILEEKKLDQIKPYKVLLTYFKTMELIQWSAFQELYKSELMRHPAFQGDKARRWEDLHVRVVQHNIRVISTYYSNITMDRLAQLLELPMDQTEKHVCDMVVEGTMWCRIDRLNGIATFTQAKDPTDVLNAWSNNISELLSKVERTCHLIHKERCTHQPQGK
jgi:26S proteasome regulatory subunit N5